MGCEGIRRFSNVRQVGGLQCEFVVAAGALRGIGRIVMTAFGAHERVFESSLRLGVGALLGERRGIGSEELDLATGEEHQGQ